MIDWPRNNVMNHLSEGNNVALIARRQTPPSLPCNYFWVSDAVVIDGVVRSDNRGSESVFPLYLFESTGQDSSAAGDGACCLARRPNLATEFVEMCADRLELRWELDAVDASDETLTPCDLLHYIYALFHCPSYRHRFAELLRVDFPRVLIPRSRDLFRVMARLGKILVDAHLLRCADPQATQMGLAPDDDFCGRIGRGYPKFSGGRVWLNKTTSVPSVPRETWEFRVGTYQVCRKWLKDRCSRPLLRAEIEQYCAIVHAIESTRRTMLELDRHIARHGDWDTVF
jgi:predicted helicase